MHDGLKIRKVDPLARDPIIGSEQAAGIDLPVLYPHVIPPMSYRKVRTGLAIELPQDCFGMIAPRSSTIGRGLIVIQGIVDPDYRGEIMVSVHNCTTSPVELITGDRVAQLVIIPHRVITRMDYTDSLSETPRGENGFGSSGQ